MTDSEEGRGPSRLRSVGKEVAILAFGLILLFVALGIFVSWVLPMLGWSMCCQ
jgi:cell division septal protein FtsQ